MEIGSSLDQQFSVSMYCMGFERYIPKWSTPRDDPHNFRQAVRSRSARRGQTSHNRTSWERSRAAPSLRVADHPDAIRKPYGFTEESLSFLGAREASGLLV